jgi:hypothetical protein
MTVPAKANIINRIYQSRTTRSGRSGKVRASGARTSLAFVVLQCLGVQRRRGMPCIVTHVLSARSIPFSFQRYDSFSDKVNRPPYHLVRKRPNSAFDPPSRTGMRDCKKPLWPANVISTKKYDVPYNCKFVLAQRCLMLSELSTKHLSSVYEKTMPFASRTPTNLTPEQRSVLTQIPADLSIERLLVRE